MLFLRFGKIEGIFVKLERNSVYLWCIPSAKIMSEISSIWLVKYENSSFKSTT